jgi:hypothetical protein
MVIITRLCDGTPIHEAHLMYESQNLKPEQ